MGAYTFAVLIHRWMYLYWPVEAALEDWRMSSLTTVLGLRREQLDVAGLLGRGPLGSSGELGYLQFIHARLGEFCL